MARDVASAMPGVTPRNDAGAAEDRDTRVADLAASGRLTELLLC